MAPLIVNTEQKSAGRETLLAWSALASAGAAVLAWAACCVVPIGLSLAGVSIAGTALLAGQRGWLTLAAAAVLVPGWWLVLCRQRACATGSTCAPPRRGVVALLTAASLLVVLALAWQSLIEPKALMMLRSWRG
jgi:mercuric ion transport protein